MAINERPLEKNGGRKRTGSSGIWLWSLAILAAVMMATAVFSQGNGAAASDTGQKGTQAQDTAPAGISISEVNDNPTEYVGKTVTLEGKLQEVISPTAIRIGKKGFLGIGGEDILILGTSAFPPGVSERAEDLNLQVTGAVTQFNRVEIERDLLIDLDDELFSVYEGRPVLVAQRIAMVGQEGDDRVGAAPGEEGVGMTPGGTAGGTGAAGGTGSEASADLARIVENTQEFYGDTVSVSGYVAKIVDSSAFSLSPTPGVSGDAILVVGNPGQIRDLVAGKEVTVKGLVRSFDQRQYESELGIDMDDVLYGEWDQDPSIRAMSIQPTETPTAEGPRERGTGGSGEATPDSIFGDTAIEPAP